MFNNVINLSSMVGTVGRQFDGGDLWQVFRQIVRYFLVRKVDAASACKLGICRFFLFSLRLKIKSFKKNGWRLYFLLLRFHYIYVSDRMYVVVVSELLWIHIQHRIMIITWFSWEIYDACYQRNQTRFPTLLYALSEVVVHWRSLYCVAKYPVF
jgi:hypothetical protein